MAVDRPVTLPRLPPMMGGRRSTNGHASFPLARSMGGDGARPAGHPSLPLPLDGGGSGWGCRAKPAASTMRRPASVGDAGKRALGGLGARDVEEHLLEGRAAVAREQVLG